MHSFRGGTGKSNATANVASLLALQGQRVGIVDTDIQSPGIHAIFGLDEEQIRHSLNDYLWGRCTIEDTAHDVSAALHRGNPFVPNAALYLIPSALRAGEIAKVLREGYDVGLLNEGLKALIARLALDYLLIDTHPGLNEETLLSMCLSDVLVLLLRPDRQDYQGTAVAVEVARKLDVPRMLLVINKVLPALDPAATRRQAEETYNVPVAGVLPLSEDLVRLGSSDVFCLAFPAHPVTAELRTIADTIAAAAGT